MRWLLSISSAIPHQWAVTIACLIMTAVLGGCVTSGEGGMETGDGDGNAAASVDDLKKRKSACEAVRLVERENGALAWADSEMRSKPPQKVAVLPFWSAKKEFIGGAEPKAASYAITVAFRNRLSQLPFNDSERAAVKAAVEDARGGDFHRGEAIDDASARDLGQRLGADAVVVGEVKRVDQLFMVAYSQIAAEVDLRMIDVDNGCVRWRGQHIARGHKGGFALDPVGTAFQVLKSLTSLDKKNRLIVIDRLTRELVAEIPSPDDAPAAFGPELVNVDITPDRRWLSPDDTLSIDVETTKRLAQGSVVIGDTLEIPLEPKARGQDAKPFAYVAERILAGADDVAPGIIRIKGVDRDGYALNAVSNDRKIGIDGNAPDRPTNVRMRYRDGKVRLAWDSASDGDVRKYVVERGATRVADFERVGSTTDTRFIDDSPLTPVGYYRVRAMDRAHQLSRAKEIYAVHEVEPGPTPVASTIESDTTWFAGASPYVLTGTVTVPRGVTLTIQPGTTVAAEPGAKLKVAGRLVAKGTAEQRIRFKLREDGKRWSGIAIIAATGQPSRLTHVEVMRAVIGLGVSSADPQIVKSTFFKNAVGIRVRDNAYPELRENTLRNNGIGLKIDAADPKVVRNTFRVNSHVDVAIEAAAPILENNNFAKGAPTAVKVADGLGSSIVTARKNWWGLTDAGAIKARLNGPVDFRPVLDGPPPDAAAVAPRARVQQASVTDQAMATPSASDQLEATTSGASAGNGGVTADMAERMTKGIAAWRNDKDNRALELLAPLVDEAKGNPTLQFALTLLYFEKGLIEKAERAASRAVKANPVSVNFHRTHGMILMRLGRTEAAQSALERALELDETDATSRTLLERLKKQSV